MIAGLNQSFDKIKHFKPNVFKKLKNNKKNLWTYGSRATLFTRVMLIDDRVLTFTNECLNNNNNDKIILLRFK